MTTSANSNGQTSVALSAELVNALNSLNVDASGFGSTEIRDGVISFPITGGAVGDSIDFFGNRGIGLDIAHAGGLSFRAGDTEVNLTDFVIMNLDDGAVLTGLVTINGDLDARAPLFNLGGRVGTSEIDGRNNLDIDDINLTLTNDAADTLNQAFGVSAFVGGFNIGTAEVDAFFDPSNGNISDRQLPVIDFADDTLLFPGATQDVFPSGSTSVELSESLVNALEDLDVQATGFGGTDISNGVADFLITGGATDLDSTEVEILHNGGLTFTDGNAEVSLTDFVINTVDSQPVLTGTVIANDILFNSVDLFDLELGDIDTTTTGIFTDLDITDVDVALSGEGAAALNFFLDVDDAFTAGFNIGTAQVDAFVV